MRIRTAIVIGTLALVAGAAVAIHDFDVHQRHAARVESTWRQRWIEPRTEADYQARRERIAGQMRSVGICRWRDLLQERARGDVWARQGEHFRDDMNYWCGTVVPRTRPRPTVDDDFDNKG